MQGFQAGATASAVLTSLAPAVAEEVSAQAAIAFATDSGQMVALNKAAQEELKRSGSGSAITEIARMYAQTDAATVGSLVGVA